VSRMNTGTVVECRGSFREIGRQYGEACRENLRNSLDFIFRVLTNGYRTTKEDVMAQAEKYIPNVQAFDPDYLEQVKGTAEAVGCDWREMFTLRCILELGVYYQKLRGLCTSFAVAGDRTREGKTILGQNIDWFPHVPLDIVKMEYENGVRVLSVSLGGFVEYSLNSSGYGMSANSLFTAPDGFRIHLPIGCYLPKVMRQSSFEEAFSLLCQAARGIGYFHLADASGRLRGIESVFDGYTVIEPSGGMLYHTNCYLTDSYQGQDTAGTILPDSFARKERMAARLADLAGELTAERMMDVLRDHDNAPTSICRHVDPNQPAEWQMTTVASLVMVPEDGVMHVAWGNPCEAAYRTYTV
jgi:isopenicillin-N N-acyltransferase like protein